jgi:hypothetical protein
VYAGMIRATKSVPATRKRVARVRGDGSSLGALISAARGDGSITPQGVAKAKAFPVVLKIGKHAFETIWQNGSPVRAGMIRFLRRLAHHRKRVARVRGDDSLHGSIYPVAENKPFLIL